MRVVTQPGKPRLRNGGPAVLRVKPVRLWFGLSQDAFARAHGVGRATVAQWEAHNAGPNPNTAEGRLLAAMIEARDLAIKS
jgi:DNA-binding transcriptional regulator YiaG